MGETMDERRGGREGGEALPADQRAHICHVLRMFLAMRAALADIDPADTPAPVRRMVQAVAAGRGMRLPESDLWAVGYHVGLRPAELIRAARRACGTSGRAAA